MIRYRVNTPLGELQLYLDNNSLICACFKNQTRHWENKLGLKNAVQKKTPQKLEKSISNFFDSKDSVLDGVSINPQGTPFQERVWKELRKVKPGKTISYSELAKKAGSPGASRAVGSACGANPLLLFVPCHRVVRSDGGIGGFSAGPKKKEYLLALEKRNK